MTKKFSLNNLVKMFVENILAEFYLRRINTLPNKWQNNGEYMIDWN